MSRTGVEQVDLWLLYRIDAKVPRGEQFDAVAQFQKEGLIKRVALHPREQHINDILGV